MVSRRNKYFQHPFGQAWLKHHAAASHTNILTARVEICNTYRNWMGGRRKEKITTRLFQNDMELKQEENMLLVLSAAARNILLGFSSAW